MEEDTYQYEGTQVKTMGDVNYSILMHINDLPQPY